MPTDYKKLLEVCPLFDEMAQLEIIASKGSNLPPNLADKRNHIADKLSKIEREALPELHAQIDQSWKRMTEAQERGDRETAMKEAGKAIKGLTEAVLTAKSVCTSHGPPIS